MVVALVLAISSNAKITIPSYSVCSREIPLTTAIIRYNGAIRLSYVVPGMITDQVELHDTSSYCGTGYCGKRWRNATASVDSALPMREETLECTSVPHPQKCCEACLPRCKFITVIRIVFVLLILLYY